jgi:hypothetical protein
MPLGIALQGQLAVLQSWGFEPKIIYTDLHGTFGSMTHKTDIGGGSDYVARVDAQD